MTNILSLPLLSAVVETATNEDWVDTFAFLQASEATAYPVAGTIGNGSIGAVTVSPGAPIGDCELEITSVVGGVTVFVLLDPNGRQIGVGQVGVLFNQGGLSFTLTQGGTAWVQGDGLTLAVSHEPIDLTGISFAMAVRLSPGDPNVILSGSVNASGVGTGLGITDPTSGMIFTNILQATIGLKSIASYVFDIIATGDGHTRRVVTGTLNLIAGITAVAA